MVAKDFLKGAFILAITVALLYMGYRVFGKASDTADIVTQQQTETSQTIEEYAIMRYDGYEISGATAISYIKTVIRKYDVPVEVTTSTESFTCSDQSAFSKFRDIGSTYYINPMDQYKVTVVRDYNDVITKVEIIYESDI